ncbi:MAG: phage tail assembly protein [Gammaproteobacteria bacterium]|nr:phage tail assembly protein [Gammaproteobacteria bacterium]
MSDPAKETIALDHPVEADGAQVTSLSMRRAKARDSRDAQRGGGSPADVEIRLFANLCEVATDVVEELDMADYGKLQDAYNRFLAG